MSATGPSLPRKAPSVVVPPKGSDAAAHYNRAPWRSTVGNSVILLGVVIIVFAIIFYTMEPSDWVEDLYLASAGVALIALVFVLSRLMAPKLPPQKD